MVVLTTELFVRRTNEWVDPGHLATIFVRRIWASQIIYTFKKTWLSLQIVAL